MLQIFQFHIASLSAAGKPSLCEGFLP